MSRVQLSALLLVGLVMFLCGTALSILAPFYASEAIKHGLSVSGSSLVFASEFIIQIIFTPIFGRYIFNLGSNRLLVAGATCSGLANIAFGFVPELRGVELFFGEPVDEELLRPRGVRHQHCRLPHRQRTNTGQVFSYCNVLFGS